MELVPGTQAGQARTVGAGIVTKVIE